MFDIGWSEFLVIGVVALIAIGPKELPGVLRMVGQWIGKARRMASEFQGQFQEALREAEMADLKKSFDEVREAATGFGSGNFVSSLQRDVDKAMDIEGVDKPATSTAAVETQPVAELSGEAPAVPTTPEPPHPETFVEAEAHQAPSEPVGEPLAEPLAIVGEVQPGSDKHEAQPAPGKVAQADAVAQPDAELKDAKAS